MPDIRDLRRASRGRLHEALSVPAIYIAPDSSETSCRVRVFDNTRLFGDVSGFDAPAERYSEVPEIVSLVAEVTPARGGVFSISAGVAYTVEVPMPADGITRKSQCTRMSETEASSLPVPSGS